MHFVVCIKQVPDSAQIRVHPVTNTIMRQGVPTIINPYDLFSLETAMRLRDQIGGEVTVLTMGPPSAEESLRKALTYGADRAVLLTDRFFAGSDTLATSYALAQAILQDRRRLGRARHRLRRQADHRRRHGAGRPGHRPPPRAEPAHLHFQGSPASTPRSAGSSSSGARRAGRRRSPPRCPASSPCSRARPRSAAAPSPTRCAPPAPRSPTWSAADAGITDLLKCGLRGSPTVVKRVFAPTPRAEKAKQIEVQAEELAKPPTT